MDKSLITYRQVNIYQQELCILEDVNLEFRQGQFVYLIGKVGTGKTSLLKTFYGELSVTKGDVAEVLDYNMLKIRHKTLPALRRKLGIVFQDFQLLIDRTVYDNLEFVLCATGWRSRNIMQKRINEVLQQVGMESKGYKYPFELSGGEQQRVVIARAILNSPQIILADEPTGNLDMETGISIVRLLHDISMTGTLVVMTTHNLQFLKMFPGKICQCHGHHVEELRSVPDF